MGERLNTHICEGTDEGFSKKGIKYLGDWGIPNIAAGRFTEYLGVFI